MSREPSWRRVAEILAERMEHAASAAGNVDPRLPTDRSDGRGCSHRLAEADPDNCPFCADREAFLVYQRKLRSTAGFDQKGCPT